MCTGKDCPPLKPIQFIIGDGKPLTPLDGTNVYSNNKIKGTNFLVMRNGIGILHYNVDYKKVATGGFEFLIPGDIFNTGEQYTLIFYK